MKRSLALMALCAALAPAGVAWSDPAPAAPADAAASDAAASGGDAGGYFDSWFSRVDAAKASQPGWMTPIATVTPRLEEEFRYDQYWEHLGNGANLVNYDAGKGLELIPTESNEVLINLPPYETRTVKKPADGIGDWSFLTVKQRFISANADHGDYIVTGFLGFQAPVGSSAFTNHAWSVTPTLAAGKGFGPADIQTTLGVQVPLDHASGVGTSLVSNSTLQLHIAEYFWPEIEANVTHWYGGPRGGKTQVFLTPAIMFGRFPLVGRSKLIVGVGYQFAVAPELALKPALTPTYQNAWILSVRSTF